MKIDNISSTGARIFTAASPCSSCLCRPHAFVGGTGPLLRSSRSSRPKSAVRDRFPLPGGATGNREWARVVKGIGGALVCPLLQFLRTEGWTRQARPEQCCSPLRRREEAGRYMLKIDPIRSGSLDLWAGVECTVNRVGDEYFDQLELSGHARESPISISSPVSGCVRFATLSCGSAPLRVIWRVPTGRGPMSASGGFVTSTSSRSWASYITAAVRATRVSSIPIFPRTRRLCPGGRGALSMGGALYTRQRTPDDRSLQRIVRPLVSSRPRRAD